ncbi:hypothetical protein MNBD_GAMMA24-385 [hydrothermal vent metagenome]|uniref:Uncharacterized protein n=1 Tax=hydrothermal vent metagenome TaxID=652676 RepID=A0A3B1B6Q2_9ZZZZ
MPTKILQILLFSISVLFIHACSTTSSLKNVWFNKHYTGAPLKNVMIIAVTKSTLNRRIFEDALVGQFGHNGVKATASYTLFPGVDKLSKKIISDKAKTLNLDGIIVTSITAIENEELYYPPATSYATPLPYYYNIWTYYPQIYETHHTHDYKINYENVKLESNLYQPESGKLLWSTQTKIFNLKSINIKALSESLAWEFIQSLRKTKLVK